MNSLRLAYYILSSIVFILLAWAFKSISRSKIPSGIFTIWISESMTAEL